MLPAAAAEFTLEAAGAAGVEFVTTGVLLGTVALATGWVGSLT